MLPPGVDPVAYILSLNVARRHMTVGARAMATLEAEACSTVEQTRRHMNQGQRAMAVVEIQGFNLNHTQRAMAVVEVQRFNLNQTQRAMAVVLGAEVSTGGHFGYGQKRELAAIFETFEDSGTRSHLITVIR